jgi:hypothetical protein
MRAWATARAPRQGCAARERWWAGGVEATTDTGTGAQTRTQTDMAAWPVDGPLGRRDRDSRSSSRARNRASDCAPATLPLHRGYIEDASLPRSVEGDRAAFIQPRRGRDGGCNRRARHGRPRSSTARAARALRATPWPQQSQVGRYHTRCVCYVTDLPRSTLPALCVSAAGCINKARRTRTRHVADANYCGARLAGSSTNLPPVSVRYKWQRIASVAQPLGHLGRNQRTGTRSPVVTVDASNQSSVQLLHFDTHSSYWTGIRISYNAPIEGGHPASPPIPPSRGETTTTEHNKTREKGKERKNSWAVARGPAHTRSSRGCPLPTASGKSRLCTAPISTDVTYSARVVRRAVGFLWPASPLAPTHGPALSWPCRSYRDGDVLEHAAQAYPC